MNCVSPPDHYSYIVQSLDITENKAHKPKYSTCYTVRSADYPFQYATIKLLEVPLSTFPSTTGSYSGMHSHLAIYNSWSGMAQDSMPSLFHVLSVIILCRCFVLILSVGSLRSSEGWQVGGLASRKMNSYSKVTTVFWDMMPVNLADG